ncbi:E3 ubiquitin-protein ligase-like isoform X2 [Toxotes jaculatrix]|uniref:E3 ubiquitin-protein ligase-like isoform X2 n=1 Tax=Toxotes jaculatrix TaxID=941984 RepID=UPI001B3AA9AC|nr:E3 ubiquitin-protein ligase-like isoform X2 [Toxotes jaculatrix]
MYSELECGVCYRTYNAGRRCPRELHCKHSFCESCLLALSRPLGHDEGHLGADRLIACPLCRQTTTISNEEKMRAELRVDECVLEQLLAAGVLDQEDDDDPEEADGQVQDGCDDEEGATLPETPAEESDSSAVSGGGRLRRSWKKVWRKISGKNLRQSDRENCMTSSDLRSLAMMSCYMF